LYGTQFLGNCVPAKSRSVPPALAGADGINKRRKLSSFHPQALSRHRRPRSVLWYKLIGMCLNSVVKFPSIRFVDLWNQTLSKNFLSGLWRFGWLWLDLCLFAATWKCSAVHASKSYGSAMYQSGTLKCGYLEWSSLHPTRALCDEPLVLKLKHIFDLESRRVGFLDQLQPKETLEYVNQQQQNGRYHFCNLTVRFVCHLKPWTQYIEYQLWYDSFFLYCDRKETSTSKSKTSKLKWPTTISKLSKQLWYRIYFDIDCLSK
jgi:hypothetical protein